MQVPQASVAPVDVLVVQQQRRARLQIDEKPPADRIDQTVDDLHSHIGLVVPYQPLRPRILDREADVSHNLEVLTHYLRSRRSSDLCSTSPAFSEIRATQASFAQPVAASSFVTSSSKLWEKAGCFHRFCW